LRGGEGGVKYRAGDAQFKPLEAKPGEVLIDNELLQQRLAPRGEQAEVMSRSVSASTG